MNVIIYGTKDDHDACVSFMEDLPELQYRQLNYTHIDNYDGLIDILQSKKIDMVMVLTDGAEGMEGVIASKNLCPGVSVIWFTDDEGFGVQSHRLGCTFFGIKPITKQIISNAIKHYRDERIN